MKIFLLHNQYFDKDGVIRKIGGVETYMEMLARLIQKEGYEPIICQYSNKPFTKDLDGFTIKGYEVSTIKELYLTIRPEIDVNHDIVIFSNDVMVCKTDLKRVISIQHGIACDVPYFSGNKFLNILRRIRYIQKTINRFETSPRRVCVDYNFYNCYKLLSPNVIEPHITVIPNFCIQSLTKEQLTEKLNQRKHENIKIIFARRFVELRGAVLFARAATKILSHHPNVEITIAGEGPCESRMKRILNGYMDRVCFTKYLPSESFEIHKEHDIAVIPTIGSEGTSLSLLEAMGAGCYVVATPVGGMSNIIINGYNGKFTMPNEESLVASMNDAILSVRTSNIQKNALDIIHRSFSLERWEAQWAELLKSI